MEIRKCTLSDTKLLAVLNKQLIDDEKSDNQMNIVQLENRMREFLQTDYTAYLFVQDGDIAGYALVKHTVQPYYLRQFLIERAFRRQHLGLQAFKMLLSELKTNSLDLEVLSDNEAGGRFWEKCGFKERSKYLRLEQN